MTNPSVIDDFLSIFVTEDATAVVRDNLRINHADEARWRSQLLDGNAKYEAMLTKVAGRSADDSPEDLVSDLHEGQLPHHILEGIAKLKGKCKEFVEARCITKKDDPEFKASFGARNAIPVGKQDRLIALYSSIKEGMTSLTVV